MYLCAKGFRREIASGGVSVLNPLKHNFPISEHEPKMFSFYPLYLSHRIKLFLNWISVRIDPLPKSGMPLWFVFSDYYVVMKGDSKPGEA